MALSIQKISGVIMVTQTGNANPKNYFGATGKYQFADDDSTVIITIGSSGGGPPDQYTVAYNALTVGTSLATTVSQAKTLLNAIFST